MFDTHDKEQNGSLSKLEIGELLKEMGLEFTQDELTFLIGKNDDDKNGTLSFGEFREIMGKSSVAKELDYVAFSRVTESRKSRSSSYDHEK